MNYRDMAKKWRRNSKMFKVLHRYYRRTDQNYVGDEWVGSINR